MSRACQPALRPGAPCTRIRCSSLVLATLLSAQAALGTLACRESATAPLTSVQSGPTVRPMLAQALGTDIALSPTGDLSGNGDAGALQRALITLQPGGAIRLAAGQFYINRPVVAPVGFDGSVIGSGKQLTSIIGVGSAATPFANAVMTTPGDFWPVEASTLFFFPRPSGELRMSDLTMTLPQGFATAPSTYGFTDLTGFVFVQLAPEGSNTSFANLRLQGATSTGNGDPFTGVDYQPLWGIGVMGSGETFPMLSSGGRHTLANSDIGRVGIQATDYQLLKHADVDIHGNVYSQDKQAIARWLDGSNVSIEGNTLDTYSFGSIVVTQEGVPVPGEPSNIVIRNNDITVKGYLGIEIGSVPDATRPAFNLLIEKNAITQAGPDPIGFFDNVAAIGMFDGQDHVTVRNNVLRGTATFAIVAEGVNNSIFVGNNLQAFVPTNVGVALFGSNNNSVVGIGRATVWDFGTGNIITGLTRAAGDVSLGDQLRAGQQRRLEILRAVSPHPTHPVGSPPDSGAVSSTPTTKW